MQVLPQVAINLLLQRPFVGNLLAHIRVPPQVLLQRRICLAQLPAQPVRFLLDFLFLQPFLQLQFLILLVGQLLSIHNPVAHV